jgi:hypothetical protein
MEKQSINQDQAIEERNPNEPIVSKKRNWTSYFKEFFMLFLAISLGFYVENQRESYLEKKSAHILAQSLLADLIKDSIALHSALRFNLEKEVEISSLLEILNSPQNTWDTLAIYQKMTATFATFPFSPTDGTYTQMKSSGTLRYFEQSLVNQMNAYDNQLRKTLFRDELIEKAEWELVPLGAEIVNFEVTGEIRFNKSITKEMYLKISDKRTLDIFINKIAVVRTMMGRSIQEYQAQLLLGEALIKEIEAKYQLN